MNRREIRIPGAAIGGTGIGNSPRTGIYYLPQPGNSPHSASVGAFSESQAPVVVSGAAVSGMEAATGGKLSNELLAQPADLAR